MSQIRKKKGMNHRLSSKDKKFLGCLDSTKLIRMDWGNLCCLTCWCPCITFGRIAEIVDRGSTSCSTSGTLYTLLCCLTGCHSIYSCTYRSKLKAQLGMPENYCADFCSHCCCDYCALCQEYRELQHRGYSLALGWYGNMERQNPGIAMPPLVPSGMVRYYSSIDLQYH